MGHAIERCHSPGTRPPIPADSREVGELRQNGLAGTPAEIVDKIGKFAELGFERVYLRVLDLDDLDHLELLASEVLPQV